VKAQKKIVIDTVSGDLVSAYQTALKKEATYAAKAKATA
jgi:hypothetical protein